MPDGLNSSGFALSSQAQAPQFPSGLGKVLAIDPEAIAQAAVNGMKRANETVDNGQQQLQQGTSLAAQIAQNRLNQAAATGTQQQVLPGSLAAQAAANQLATTKAATESPVVATANQGALAAAGQSNTVQQQAFNTLKGLPQQLSTIAQEPDPAKRYQMYSDFQSQHPELTHPSVAAENSLISNLRAQDLAIVQARAAQAAKLQQIGAVVQGRQGVAETAAGGRSDVATINAGARTQSAQITGDARTQAAGGALNVATSRYNDALDNLANLMATPDTDPASIDAAERDVATKQGTLNALRDVQTQAARRTGAQAGAVLTPQQVQAEQDAKIKLQQADAAKAGGGSTNRFLKVTPAPTPGTPVIPTQPPPAVAPAAGTASAPSTDNPLPNL